MRVRCGLQNIARGVTAPWEWQVASLNRHSSAESIWIQTFGFLIGLAEAVGRTAVALEENKSRQAQMVHLRQI